MRYLVTTIAGLLGMAAGWIAGAALTIGLGTALGASDREGGLAMFAFFGIGPFAGFAGLVAGVWFILRRWKVVGLAALAAHVLAAVLAIGVLSAAVASVFWMKQPYVATNALPPALIFEIRLPEGASPPPLVSRSEAYARRSPIELQTSENTMSAEIESVREEGGRSVVTGRVEMAFRTSERLLVLKQASGDVVFMVKLAATPEGSPDFGTWQPPAPIQGEPPPGSYEIRYRASYE